MPVTPVGNGEHAADAAVKAAAKAALAAEKAAKAEAEKVLKPLTAAARKAAGSFSGFTLKAEEAQHVLGVAILAVEKALAQYPVLGLTIRTWCEAELPSVSGPVFGSSPAYRALCAARVVEKAPDYGYLSVNALCAAHRVRDTKGAVPKVLKAAKAKAEKAGTAVTAAVVDEAAQDLYPKAEGSTPGPVKGTEAAKAGAKAKAAKAGTTRNTPTEPTEKPDLAVSATRLKAAATRVDTLFGNVATADRSAAYVIAETVLRSCEDYGTAATRLAVLKYQPKAKAARAKTTAKATK